MQAPSPIYQFPTIGNKKAYRSGGNSSRDTYKLIKPDEILVVDGHQCNVTVEHLNGELRLCGDFNHVTVQSAGPSAHVSMRSTSSRIVNDINLPTSQGQLVACGQGMNEAKGVPSRITYSNGGTTSVSTSEPLKAAGPGYTPSQFQVVEDRQKFAPITLQGADMDNI